MKDFIPDSMLHKKRSLYRILDKEQSLLLLTLANAQKNIKEIISGLAPAISSYNTVVAEINSFALSVAKKLRYDFENCPKIWCESKEGVEAETIICEWENFQIYQFEIQEEIDLVFPLDGNLTDFESLPESLNKGS